MSSETTAAATSEMEAKLQALFQTMVAEHVVESEQQQQQSDTTIPTNTTTLVLTTDADGNILTQEAIDDGSGIAGVTGQEELIIQEDGTIVRFASQANQQNGGQILENEEDVNDEHQQSVTITSHDHTTASTTDITTYEEVDENQQQHLVNGEGI